MKRYFTLPHKRKKRFSFVLGVGDITGTFKTKKLHLRYIPDALREEAGLFSVWRWQRSVSAHVSAQLGNG